METLLLPTTRQSGSKTTSGHYQSDVLKRQIAKWIMLVLQPKSDPPQSKPLTVHLDQLLGTPIEQNNVVAVSFQAFRIFIEQLEATVTPDTMSTIMPSLYIPLECTEALIAGPFGAETLVQQINSVEPPSLYLTDRTLQTKMLAIERYVFPLQASDFLEDDHDVHVYYSATRSREDIANGWEYGRNIVAEYYPQAYQVLP